MTKTSHMRKKVRDFILGEERILLLPFNGMTENVSKHWHRFLCLRPLSLVWKTIVLWITRNMHSSNLKNALLRSIGVKIGNNVFIAATATLDPQFPELISIDDNVIIGMYTHIFTHEVTHMHIRLGKVHIGKNVLIGALSSVRSGVTIDDNAVVGMEAFANVDIPAQTLVTGDPERETKHLRSVL